MVASANSLNPETDNESQPGGDAQISKGSQLDEIAKLLTGDDDGSEGGEPGESQHATNDDDDDDGKGKPGESQNHGKPPKTLNEIAERLGVEVKDLFGIEFNSGDAKGKDNAPVTLGQLKDLFNKQDEFEIERLTFAEDRTKTEAGFLKAQSELTDIISMIPKNAIKPELINAIKDKREQTITRERGYTLNAIPAWKDGDVETKDRNEMREHLGEYGYSKNYIDNVVDHRMLKYIRDNMQRQQRIRAALEKVRKVETPAHKQSGKTSKKPAPASQKNRRNQSQQVAAVAELLSS